MLYLLGLSLSNNTNFLIIRNMPVRQTLKKQNQRRGQILYPSAIISHFCMATNPCGLFIPTQVKDVIH